MCLKSPKIGLWLAVICTYMCALAIAQRDPNLKLELAEHQPAHYKPSIVFFAKADVMHPTLR